MPLEVDTSQLKIDKPGDAPIKLPVQSGELSARIATAFILRDRATSYLQSFGIEAKGFEKLSPVTTSDRSIDAWYAMSASNVRENAYGRMNMTIQAASRVARMENDKQPQDPKNRTDRLTLAVHNFDPSHPSRFQDMPTINAYAKFEEEATIQDGKKVESHDHLEVRFFAGEEGERRFLSVSFSDGQYVGIEDVQRLKQLTPDDVVVLPEKIRSDISSNLGLPIDGLTSVKGLDLRGGMKDLVGRMQAQPDVVNMLSLSKIASAQPNIAPQ